MEDKSLSEFRQAGYKNGVFAYPEKDVREFIKRLKEELHDEDWEIVDKLAGDKLT